MSFADVYHQDWKSDEPTASASAPMTATMTLRLRSEGMKIKAMTAMPASPEKLAFASRLNKYTAILMSKKRRPWRSLFAPFKKKAAAKVANKIASISFRLEIQMINSICAGCKSQRLATSVASKL